MGIENPDHQLMPVNILTDFCTIYVLFITVIAMVSKDAFHNSTTTYDIYITSLTEETFTCKSSMHDHI